MKYLKLRVAEELPISDDKNVHITFAYFGKVDVNKEHIMTVLSNLPSFTIIKIKSDLFGKDKTIPVVVYKISEKSIEIILQDARSLLLTAYDIHNQNFANWIPHISGVNFNESPDIIHVLGIDANDESMSIDLIK